MLTSLPALENSPPANTDVVSGPEQVSRGPVSVPPVIPCRCDPPADSYHFPFTHDGVREGTGRTDAGLISGNVGMYGHANVPRGERSSPR